MKRREKTADMLKRYMNWPIWITLIIVLATCAVFYINKTAGLVMSAFALVAVVLSLSVYFSSKNSLMKGLVSFAMDTSDSQNMLAQMLDVPYAIMDVEGNINWKNKRFEEVLNGDGSKSNIRDLFENLSDKEIAAVTSEKNYHLVYRDKRYHVVIRHILIDGIDEYPIYLYDETSYMNLLTKSENDKPVVGLIYMDNPEEMFERIDDSQKSLLIALVDKKINKFIKDNDGILMKPEKDKYQFVIKHMYLEQIETAKFDILEEVKKINMGTDIKVTLSIGVGLGQESYADNYMLARQAMDMALARGGDQAVVKEGKEIRYFGGRSQSIEKSTRVKARVKANAFEEIISSKERLIIMGHKLMDIDSLGAAVGVWRIAVALGKKAHIILGDYNATIGCMIERFENNDYPEDMFIDKAKAMDVMDANCALVIVDVNRPSITEAPELLDVADTVVVFDHHRQGSEVIEQAVLSYIEPFASSASEMVAEIAQYVSVPVKLKSAEADAMYAGIVIDTNNFTNQTGVRTFEAAAFLRSSGADAVRVRKLFRDSIEDYKAKAEAIHNAEIYEDAFAITVCNAEESASPTVVGAKAANELLGVVGIKASIVLTEYNGKIYVSARSIDEVNVQVIMEKLGGGGHRSIAGAQFEGITIDEAIDKIKALISDMNQKGELN